MSLIFDPVSKKIKYRDTVIGEHVYENGRSIVRLNLEYETADDWIPPLSWLAHGLSLLNENRPAPALLELETHEDGIAEEFECVRFLTERQVRRKNFIWSFHKNDADNWPSSLHGHEYEKGLTLDVITGEVYDKSTRQLCKRLKSKDLKKIQYELRSSKDFGEAVKKFIDKD
ncbi:MAG: hypothetical protein INF84_09975 [Roseomonas sp.]|nr:hypothetical protein [Roseomonas sp.]